MYFNLYLLAYLLMEKILIVDSDEQTRFLISDIVQKKNKNHSILLSKDGAEGIHLAKKETPSLVITGLLMKEVDGYEFVGYLHCMKNPPVIIAMTEATNSDDKKQCDMLLRSSIDDVITVDKRTIESELPSLLERCMKKLESDGDR